MVTLTATGRWAAVVLFLAAVTAVLVLSRGLPNRMGRENPSPRPPNQVCIKCRGSQVTKELCQKCVGVGSVQISINCNKCSGKGKAGGLFGLLKRDCSDCSGTGKLSQRIECDNCRGSGNVSLPCSSCSNR